MRSRLLHELESVLAADYEGLLVDRPADEERAPVGVGASPEERVDAAPVPLLRFEVPLTVRERVPVARLRGTRSEENAREAQYEEDLAALAAKLADFEIADLPVVTDELLVATRGLYLEALVGMNPGTEPYSELVRDQEVRRREVDSELVAARAALLRARAAAVAGDDSDGDGQ